MLDSGVDYTHIDLRTNIWLRPDNVPAYYDDELGEFNDEHGYNGVEPISDPMDDNGHGTHCAGIIGAEGNNDEGIAGINWNVQIMPLKFLGRGGFGTTKDAIEAINYAIDRKKAASTSASSTRAGARPRIRKRSKTRSGRPAKREFCSSRRPATTAPTTTSGPHYPSNYDLPNVISVAATDRTDALTSFSNFGVEDGSHRRTGPRYRVDLAGRRVPRSFGHVDGGAACFGRRGIDPLERART